MTKLPYTFYECENPDCRLRFPGTDENLRWKRCPICRSQIHKVASVEYRAETNNHNSHELHFPVEVMLDNVRSAWNVGSIFRTSDGIGVHKLYLCGITPTPENNKVSKTALGAERSVSWLKENNGVQLAKKLKSNGHILWAFEGLPGAQSLFQVPITTLVAPLVLIFGNEINGIDPGIIKLCDNVISIPMVGNKQSYNVAIAFGITIGVLFYRHNVSHGSLRILPSI